MYALSVCLITIFIVYSMARLYERERKRREPVQNMSCFIGIESQKFQ